MEILTLASLGKLTPFSLSVDSHINKITEEEKTELVLLFCS